MKKKIKLSAIIACYKDAQAIPIMYQRLKKVFSVLVVDYEIIFVNDGSPDDTFAILENICQRDKHVIAIHHSRNFGSQNAFTSGLRIATSDAVILLDGDLQDPPELIDQFIQKWQEGYEVVYGIRVKRDATLFLQIAYKLFYRIFRAASYIPMPLDAGDFSLLDRRVVDSLNQLPENNRFIRGLRSWVGFRQTGIPYKRPERLFGKTTNSLFKNLGWARRGIFSFSYIPIDLITWLAFGAVILSFTLIILYVLVLFVKPGLISSSFAILVIMILFIGGIQLLSLSIIGSYIAHIYDEVKRRPPYIISKVTNYQKK
jgi:dolichol-phosphate mannosyltransferase